MKIVKSCMGVPVRLTPERTEHIERRHPEMSGEGERILETFCRSQILFKRAMRKH
jgi:hypothetical protein